MNNNKTAFRLTLGGLLTVLLCTMAGCMTLASDNPLGIGKSWKEEVILHDGNKIIVKRSQDYDPRGHREIGQGPPRSEETLRFTIPETKQDVTWKSDFGRELEDNLTLLALDIFNDTPYIVTHPTRCHAYNKWGRPNPPYVCFKYDGTSWQRIPFEEIPLEMKEGNVIFGGYSEKWDRERLWNGEPVSSEEIKKINSLGVMPYLRAIVRDPLDLKKIDCVEMVHKIDGGWLSIDWFTSQPNYKACLDVCGLKKISPQECPCDRIFNKDNKEQ